MADIVYFYGSLYAPQIVLVATLSAITIFRRQISCNHVYAEEEEEQLFQGDNSNSRGGNNEQHLFVKWNEKEAEEILNGAGLFCSGTPLRSIVVSVSKLFYLQSTVEGGASINDCGVSCLLQLKHNISTGDLLELAGNFYCGEPVASILLCKPIRIPVHRESNILSALSRGIVTNENPDLLRKKSEEKDMLGLPTDAWIHIMSFLTPKEVVTFSCTDKACRAWVDDGESSSTLWSTLWRRDYAWILQSWTIGRNAAARSFRGCQRPEPPSFSKHTYFRFGLCYLDYVLAGCNTFEECLVGIGGHIYDISFFLMNHPGSPETVMVHAGQDATDFFSRIGHSKGARRMAKSMCVVVDQSRLGGGNVGLSPTTYTKFTNPALAGTTPLLATMIQPPQPLTAVEPPVESIMNASCFKNHTLVSAQTAFDRERDDYQASTLRRFSISSCLTQPKAFYNPLAERWQAWYMDCDMKTVFLDGVD